LVGLMFVAIWLGSNLFTEQSVVGLRTFMSPTLMHFVYVLITSAVVLIPTVTRTFLGILLLLVGFISVGISLSGVPYVRHQYRRQQTDMTDWMWYFLSPRPVISSMWAAVWRYSKELVKRSTHWRGPPSCSSWSASATRGT